MRRGKTPGTRNPAPPIRRIKLTVAYEGTHYAGWQRQRNARSVQATLEQALQKILGQPVHLVGAGRTDSGVHALGQVAHADIASLIPLTRLKRALNAVLPEDIVILSIQKTSSGFHARYQAKAKRYRYTIFNRPERPLFDRAFVHHVPVPLDLTAMRQAARLLKGRHDFKAFHSSGRAVSSTVRTIRHLSLRVRRRHLIVEIEADGFLYRMVRRLVGLLIEIGKGKYPPSVVRKPLEGNHSVVPPTAPANGLCLRCVRY